MTFHEFESEARRVFEAIPARYREGVDGLTVYREALSHPRFERIFTLGECVTESYPSGWDGPETVRSLVVLYWGSFVELAKDDPEFDWEGQVHETITHELLHHLESLADTDDLGAVDRAVEESFRRYRGEKFTLDYYRRGERVGPGAWAVEDDVYIEPAASDTGSSRDGGVCFTWRGLRYRVDAPANPEDVHFIHVRGGIEAPPWIQVVLVGRLSWTSRLRALLGGAGRSVGESDSVAVPVAPPSA